MLKHNLLIKLDRIGFIAATLCAIHCMAMPFIFVFLTLYSLQFAANPIIEFSFIAASILIGVFTFRHGYYKHHGRIYPFFMFMTGLVIVLTGHFVLDAHSHADREFPAAALIAPIGAMIIGLAHYFNRKLSKNSCAASHSC